MNAPLAALSEGFCPIKPRLRLLAVPAVPVPVVPAPRELRPIGYCPHCNVTWAWITHSAPLGRVLGIWGTRCLYMITRELIEQVVEPEAVLAIAVGYSHQSYPPALPDPFRQGRQEIETERVPLNAAPFASSLRGVQLTDHVNPPCYPARREC